MSTKYGGWGGAVVALPFFRQVSQKTFLAAIKKEEGEEEEEDDR